jgi:mRNA interferase MazF
MSTFGQVILVAFPNRSPKGHEQTGVRPALVVSDPSNRQRLESPMLIVAPITTQKKLDGALRLKLKAGTGGLPYDSVMLCEQLTSIDVSRIRGAYGRLEGQPLEEARTAVKTALTDLLEEV